MTETTGNSRYIVSARKYRPATFQSVVGQKTLTATLKNAIQGDRLAQAYLFCGPRGVGKTSCARIFARTINCLNRTPEGEACGQCASCRAIDEGNSFNVIELDAASNNSVDDIRALTDQVNQQPQGGGRYRVFIIDEVHMLSQAAFNAFLKTLEEPPSYVVFILATTEKHKVLPTILSRCQTYDFKRITIQDMVEHLQYVAQSEGITAEPSALGVIAVKADGAMRDALSIFDQVAASSHGNITYQSTIDNLNVLDHEFYFRLVEAFRAGAVTDAMLLLADIRERGFDMQFFVNGLANHIRDLMLAVDERTLPLLEVPEDVAARFRAQAPTLPTQWYYAALKILTDTDVNYRTSGNRQLLVELALIRLCQLLTPVTPPFDRVDADIPLQAPTATPAAIDAAPRPTPSQAPPRPIPTSPAAPQPVPVQTPAQPATQPSVSLSGVPSSVTSTEETASPRRRPRRKSTISISDTTDAEAIVGAGLTHRREPITPEGLRQAWEAFIDANPEQQILTTTMRTSLPTDAGNGQFILTVATPPQKTAFDTEIGQLTSFMRERLKNDDFTLTVTIDASRDTDHRLPPQDFLRQAVDNNPDLGNLLTALDVEMA